MQKVREGNDEARVVYYVKLTPVYKPQGISIFRNSIWELLAPEFAVLIITNGRTSRRAHLKMKHILTGSRRIFCDPDHKRFAKKWLEVSGGDRGNQRSWFRLHRNAAPVLQ